MTLQNVYYNITQSIYSQLWNHLSQAKKIGETTLHTAVSFKGYEFLLSHGANVNAKGKKQQPALHLAVKENKLRFLFMIQIMLDIRNRTNHLIGINIFPSNTRPFRSPDKKSEKCEFLISFTEISYY
ncbi:hypothetical protein TVAG_026200 [Trichomonas vaginalis G3]|uniref:Uncharacterized protein n=1 Tax=Trichomonas vaginalis (strain ATCC PRA-98 / G3) TaxID=412133 RepID=A2DZ23_TRIV3|nr:proteasome regulatory particle assembly [Trichomonas vaginalis G3]EAY14299.1 hypothetical protein TVAG_026200 [Trichomonas vaginalis G3]KAI5517326.1 proteasome regulatory particle assembly [Trichomonas vaginalis G3]|eukprot:XP_001326522.1 hypothetical protein [Trichomonas vaginalis G3]